jgi:OmpA-OmpF porin, OOP family
MMIRRMLIAGVLGCMPLGLGALQLAAQNTTPSESDIGRALRPAPQGLGPEQGVPKLGPAPPAPANPNVQRSSAVGPSPGPAAKAQKTKPAPAAAASGAQPSIGFNSIQFALNSAQLTAGSIDTLRNLGNALNHELADQKTFLIEGHTDKSGGLRHNMVLSLQRADAVKDYLVREVHVAPGRLQTVGKGPTEPLNPADPYAPQNRRVVVVNLGK